MQAGPEDALWENKLYLFMSSNKAKRVHDGRSVMSAMSGTTSLFDRDCSLQNRD